MSASSLKQELSSNDISQLVKWFIDSYEDGWRPRIYVPTYEEKRYERLVELKTKHLDTP